VCDFFSYNIVLVGENMEEDINRLDEWRLVIKRRDRELVEVKQSISSMSLEQETKMLTEQ